jgi:hypothetical protein
MPNPIKYSTGSETLALKKGNFYIGTGAVGKGPTSETGYYNGITPPTGGYTIYLNKESNGPSIYTASNNAELISLTNSIAGQSYTGAQQCFDYFYGQTDKVLVNQDYPPDYPYIVMDGLVLNLDAGITQSYPGSGTTWTDVNGLGPKNNGTLTNGPTFNSANGGSIVFDGTNDYLKIYSFSSFPIQGPGTISFFASYSTISSVKNIITIGDGSGTGNINAIQIGTRNGQGCVWKAGGEILLNTASPTLNTIQHWTITFSGSIMSSYLNGNLNTTTSSASNQSGESTIFYIGTYRDTGLEAFGGTVYNCQLYNKVLTSSEVLQNYNAQKGRFGL